MTLNHYQRYLIEEFADDYLGSRMSRRDLLKRVLLITGSVPLTASLLIALRCGDSAAPAATAVPSPSSAVATTAAGIGPGVSPTDPAIEAGSITIPGPASQLFGYLARPRASGTFPGVIIVHENQGLLEHFRDIARRYAKEGFVGLAIDLGSRQGGSKEDPSQNTALLRLGTAEFVADMLAYVEYLKTRPFVRPAALAATGFCFGGSMTWELAVASQDIRVAVPYYGTAPVEQLGSTRAAVLAIYGETDRFINPQIPAVEERLKATGKTHALRVYPGAGHAFFADHKTSYHEPSAKAAWTETLAWLRRHLAS